MTSPTTATEKIKTKYKVVLIKDFHYHNGYHEDFFGKGLVLYNGKHSPKNHRESTWEKGFLFGEGHIIPWDYIQMYEEVTKMVIKQDVYRVYPEEI